MKGSAQSAGSESRGGKFLYRILSYRFRNEALLIEALTHRSYLSENSGERQSNERMEFLGDAVLGLVVTDELYRCYPAASEGELTKIKSMIVSRDTLAVQAKKMGLGDVLILGNGEEKSGGRKRTSILADAYEALLGAIYLDGGLESVRRFLGEHLLYDIDAFISAKKHVNYKSDLLEYAQKRWQVKPSYSLLEETGPDHRKEFLVEVRVGDKILGTGRGQSKKKAEQEAARQAIRTLGLSEDQDS